MYDSITQFDHSIRPTRNGAISSHWLDDIKKKKKNIRSLCFMVSKTKSFRRERKKFPLGLSRGFMAGNWTVDSFRSKLVHTGTPNRPVLNETYFRKRFYVILFIHSTFVRFFHHCFRAAVVFTIFFYRGSNLL